MKSIFLVWKDKNCNGENPEWIHMTAKEFFEFKQKPENSERKFVQVEDKNLSSKYSVIFIEANKELYKKCNAEHSEDMRRKEEKKKYPRGFVSLDKLRGVMIRTRITTRDIRITGGRKILYWISSKRRNCIRR